MVQNPGLTWIQNWPADKPIPVGYFFKLDLTGKDGYNHDTLGDQGVHITFAYSDPSMVEERGNHPWQPRLLAKKPGILRVVAIFDGVSSNTLELRFYEE
jgi:hypothetical protein